MDFQAIALYLLYLLVFFLSIATALHALLNKRDSHAALAWIAVCLFLPMIGAAFYLIFGLNRVRNRARKLGLRELSKAYHEPSQAVKADRARRLDIDEPFLALEYLAFMVSGQRLLSGNTVCLLDEANMAYTQMINAIEAAQESVYLASYIFDGKGVGRRFVDALLAARMRGVDVKVLIDGVGRFYSRPGAYQLLLQEGVDVALFLPPTIKPLRMAINMRNHRKLLVVDQQQAFTGGMNIRDKYTDARSAEPEASILDLHFKMQGAVVEQLTSSFLQDWAFVKGQEFIYPLVSDNDGASPALCRVLEDGPNSELDNLIKVMVTAIATAQRSIYIVSPYFLPPRELALALQTAALRGVEVTVIVPDNNNLPFVDWAMQHMLFPLLKAGVKVHRFLPCFLHTKLYLIDDYYALVGSANMDPRSLRLNFELMVEIYDKPTGLKLNQYIQGLLAKSDAVSLKQLASRPWWCKYRDAVFWLFSPYL